MSRMSVSEYTRILGAASADEVNKISALITSKYTVKIVKQPQKSLAMVQVREPVGASLFYLGEILCSECMVEICGEKGFCVIMGDDFDKALNCAIIDGGINAEVEQCDEIFSMLEQLDSEQKKARRYMNGEILKSKVNFSLMGEG